MWWGTCQEYIAWIKDDTCAGTLATTKTMIGPLNLEMEYEIEFHTMTTGTSEWC